MDGNTDMRQNQGCILRTRSEKQKSLHINILKVIEAKFIILSSAANGKIFCSLLV